jgi:hypothetical protein
MMLSVLPLILHFVNVTTLLHTIYVLILMFLSQTVFLGVECSIRMLFVVPYDVFIIITLTNCGGSCNSEYSSNHEGIHMYSRRHSTQQ